MSDSISTASGIYKITCTANKKIYIGSAVNLQARKRQHWYALNQNNHHNPILQNAWNKHGEQAFTFEVLEQVLPISLTAREQYWLEKLNPFGKRGFNIYIEAGSPLGMKRSPETCEKLSANAGRKRMKAGLMSFKFTSETISFLDSLPKRTGFATGTKTEFIEELIRASQRYSDWQKRR